MSLSLVEAPLTVLYIDNPELYIIRDVSLSGLKIHSNAMYSHVYVNQLPSGLVIDDTRRMIVGTYDGNYSGIFNSTFQICNGFGCLSRVFSFILSCISFLSVLYEQVNILTAFPTLFMILRVVSVQIPSLVLLLLMIFIKSKKEFVLRQTYLLL